MYLSQILVGETLRDKDIYLLLESHVLFFILTDLEIQHLPFLLGFWDFVVIPLNLDYNLEVFCFSNLLNLVLEMLY